MPQLRLTQKFSKNLHISTLSEPQVTTSMFDDWIIDVVRAQRKKVALMVHVKSYLPLFIPYQTIGGAQNIVSALGMLLSEWVIKNGHASCCQSISKLFAESITFCKTVDKRALGYMNEYKYHAPFFWEDVRFEDIDWQAQTQELADMPLLMKHERVKYPTPGSLMLDLIERGS